MYQELSEIKDLGFSGFKSIQQLWNDHSVIPNVAGIYIIINPNLNEKKFLSKGVGGFFKGKDPNLSIEDLNSNWVDDSPIVYIGKAGGINSSATLRKRLKQYLDFGRGKSVGHYGGRLIWQLTNHKELIVAWKASNENDPRKEERSFINNYLDNYKKLPFANLTL